MRIYKLMGGRTRSWVPSPRECSFLNRCTGGAVHETRREKKGSNVVLKVGVVAACTAAGFSLATTAHAAIDPPPPTPLERSAMTMSGDGDAAGVAATPVPVEASASTEESSDVTPPPNVEPPANPPIAVPQKVPVRPARATEEWHLAVISVARVASRPTLRRGTAEAVHHASHRWYQDRVAQYRPAQATHVAPVPSRASKRVGVRAAGTQQSRSTVCPLLAKKCLRFCSATAAYNLSGTAGSIPDCISPKVVERFRAIIAVGLPSLEKSSFRAIWRTRYQCVAPRYHFDGCADHAHTGTGPAAGWALFRPSTEPPHRHPTSGALVRPLRLPPTVAAVSQDALASELEEQLPARQQPQPTQRAAQRSDAAGPLSSATNQRDGGWFMRALVISLGLTGIALLLALFSDLDALNRTALGVRSRLGSKGLSPGRSSADQKPTAIRYRD
jgi:hypothetical protein